MKNLINIPKTICFRITRRCNVKCSFCQAPPTSEYEMSLDDIKKCIDKFALAGMHSIKFTGGEPFIKKNICEILLYCRKRGILPVVCTNGILINDNIIKVLCECKAKVKVSLHGIPEDHNVLAQNQYGELIANNVVRMAKSGIFVSLHTIVTKQNKDRLNLLLDFCVKNGIKKISFISLIERGNGKSELKSQGVPLDEVKKIVKDLQNQYPKLDLRVLDFSNNYYVLESNGKLYIEVDNENQDTYLYNMLDSESKLACTL